ncbi:MAG: hypothetical protein Q8O53_00155 [Candidatus Moranbacteria bacterium]|nr:hypothetical protein [Candidatus Moranbacteria bacterium]
MKNEQSPAKMASPQLTPQQVANLEVVDKRCLVGSALTNPNIVDSAAHLAEHDLIWSDGRRQPPKKKTASKKAAQPTD